MLIVFGGLPGTGKTTLSRLVAQDLSATWLRIDVIEVAMWRSGIAREEPTGLAAYVVANALADAQLGLGATVVIDAVNPVEEALGLGATWPRAMEYASASARSCAPTEVSTVAGSRNAIRT
jgi:AAA domain